MHRKYYTAAVISTVWDAYVMRCDAIKYNENIAGQHILGISCPLPLEIAK
jgi:hypothetical protein